MKFLLGMSFAYFSRMKVRYMKNLKIVMAVLILPLLAFTAHKFYVSVTNINYSEKDDALQITSRIFIDDLENVLQERYDIEGKLNSDKESELAEMYLEKYLRSKFVLAINGENRPFDIIGRKYDDDVCIFYLEITDVDLPTVNTIQIENELLTDLYDEQQNVVHFKIKGKKKSFVLIKSDTKGMLNL